IAEELFPATLIPVCTPAMARTFKGPADLAKATLIVVSHLRDQWAWWFKAVGLASTIQTAGEVVFESSPMAIQAVLDGVGVAIAQLPYVSDALASKRLVAPFPIAKKRFESWYLAYRPVREGDSALLPFRDWLHREAALQRAEYERLMVSR